MLLLKTDAEVRRLGYRKGLETPVVLAENDVCCCVYNNRVENNYNSVIIHTLFSARTNEGVKHTTWGVWSQGGNPNH